MRMLPTLFFPLALVMLVIPDVALAAPPDWAPAHGWREKHDDDGEWKRHKHDKRHKRHKHSRKKHDDWEDDDWDDDDYRDRRRSDHGGNWPSDYGVIRGECDREAIGAVLGGVVGGVVGSRTSSEENRKVAILLGGVVGAVIGAEIGRRMDERDRACVGHALELTSDGRPVWWRNDHDQATYVLTPLKAFSRDGLVCREFDLEVSAPGRPADVSRHRACRATNGRWQMAS